MPDSSVRIEKAFNCRYHGRIFERVTPIHHFGIVKMHENVIVHEKLIAIIVRANYSAEEVTFFTPNHFSQQLGYMRRPQGYTIPPHVHNVVKRQVYFTKEVLFIKSGKIRVDFYDDNKAYFESRILKCGDVLLLASGGHGFEMLEPTELIEVKQGPYAGDNDKTRFTGITTEQVRVVNE